MVEMQGSFLQRKIESSQITATTGEHNHPLCQAQASTNTVITLIKKRAREESAPLPQIYRQELAKLSGTPKCTEVAVNVPSFQSLKSSLYRNTMIKEDKACESGA